MSPTEPNDSPTEPYDADPTTEGLTPRVLSDGDRPRLVVDPDDRVVSATAAAVDHLITVDDELIGATTASLVLPDGRTVAELPSSPLAGTDLTVVDLPVATGRTPGQAATAADLLDATADAIVSCDRHQAITSWNTGAELLTGHGATEVVGRTVHEVLATGAGPTPRAAVAQALRTGTHQEWEGPLRRADGAACHATMRISALATPAGTPTGAVIVIRDVTQRRLADEAIQRDAGRNAALAALAQSALASNELAQVRRDALELLRRELGGLEAQLWTFQSDDSSVMTGSTDWVAPPEVPLRVAKSPGSLLDRFSRIPDGILSGRTTDVDALATRLPISRHRATRYLAARLEGRDIATGAIIVLHDGEGPYSPDDQHFARRVAAILGNATERAKVADTMRHQALHDSLTGLPNRSLLGDRLDHALHRSLRTGEQIALLHIDLDLFKRLNDSLGHAAGDRALLKVARRLNESVQPGDTVARLAGDEFAVLAESAATLGEAAELADRIRRTVAEPLEIEGRGFVVSASIGVATAAAPVSSDDLLRRAELAMFRSKDRGRDQVSLYEPSMQLEVSAQVEIEHELRLAVTRRQIDAVYQPKIDIASGEVTGFEVLSRWNHPTLGSVPPSSFIGVAEESGLVGAIGELVLERACRRLVVVRRRLPHAGMAVNVSTRQLATPNLSAMVARVLHKNSLPGSALTLEVTESAILDDMDVAERALQAIRTLGVRVSIDDFGTGYSSLSHLAVLPVDEVKIDRSFTSGLGRDNRSGAIVGGVVAMAHALGLTVVAEGVERTEEVELLRTLGCDQGQGWLWSRPMSAFELDVWLSDSTFAGVG